MFLKQFYLPKTITQDILDDLNQNFKDKIEFIQQDEPIRIIYRAEDNKFYMSNIGTTNKNGYAIAGLGLSYAHDAPKIFNNGNKEGFAIVSYDRSQMFGIQDPKTKEIVTQIYDFLKDKYNIDIKASCLNNSLGEAQFLFSFYCVSPKIEFKSPLKIDAKLYAFLHDRDFTISKYDKKAPEIVTTGQMNNYEGESHWSTPI